MARAGLSGVTGENMKEAGTAVSRAASDTTLTSTVSNERAFGSMVGVSAG